MAKYKNILVRKLEEEKQEEQEQNRLRKESGIKNQSYHLRERSIQSYGRDIMHGIGYALYMALAFIGVLAVLHPESRNILFTIIRHMIPG